MCLKFAVKDVSIANDVKESLNLFGDVANGEAVLLRFHFAFQEIIPFATSSKASVPQGSRLSLKRNSKGMPPLPPVDGMSGSSGPSLPASILNVPLGVEPFITGDVAARLRNEPREFYNHLLEALPAASARSCRSGSPDPYLSLRSCLIELQK